MIAASSEPLSLGEPRCLPPPTIGAFHPRAVESPGGGRVQDKRDPPASDVVMVRGLDGSVPLHRLAAQAWTALVAAARGDGIAAPLLLPVSGYRSSEHQQRLWTAALARYGSPEVARRWVAPPGASAHQSGRAIDLYLGGRNDSANVGQLRTLPAYRWLVANARRFGFYPYDAEPWHWEYNPRTGGGAGPPAVRPRASGGVPAGHAEVQSVPALAGHRGRPPALVLRWNDMRKVPSEIDVVVHLHGFSRTGLTLPSDIEPVSGLDLRGRARPTLTILPRGDDTGVKQKRGRRFIYTFPGLDGTNGRRDGLSRLIEFSLQRFAQATGVAPPRAGRLILTAHSGGGPPLLRMLRFVDPDEVHIYDALYAPAGALADWARRHLARDRAGGGGREPGALRVFYRRDSGTAEYSRWLRAALGRPAGRLARRYRVELSTLDHMEIPRAYGWRMLADASADVPQSFQ